jgi:peroxiredoxin
MQHMKRLFLLVILCSLMFQGNTQDGHPVSWKIDSEKIGPLTHKVQLHASVKEPYHIYPQGFSGSGMGMPTTILFKEDINVELMGEIEEKGDEQTGGETLAYYSKGATFTQTVRLKSDTKTLLHFRIKYMACTDLMCLAPSSKQFTIVLNDQGAVTGNIQENTENVALNKQQVVLKYEDFKLPDTGGKMIVSRNITSKSKYTFIDFWASWCVPCRAQARELMPVYDKYSPKGFSVIGVSLDTDASAWKKAIRNDGYKWTNLSDLKGFDSPISKKYGIIAIPRNFLINDKGVIVGMDLHGKELEMKLAELFN